MDVAARLKGLGLERYVPAFCENDVDAEVLPKLTADDLIGLGVTSIGHRRKLLDAIIALSTEIPPATAAASPREIPVPAGADRWQLTVMFCDLVGSTSNNLLGQQSIYRSRNVRAICSCSGLSR